MNRRPTTTRSERRKAQHRPAAATAPSTRPDPAPPAGPTRFGAWFDKLLPWLPLAALIVVAAFSLRRLDDFDTWWHLASGRWIAQHHAVPHHDVLSFTVPGNEWVNLQWLYDLLLYALWSVAGPSALVIASAACFVATFALLARHILRHVGPVAATVLLIWTAASVNERFVIRPEMASFPLLAAVQLVLAAARAHPARLRWLVPLMILWANVHALFILGVAAIAAAIGGALIVETPILPEGWRRDSAWPEDARRALLRWGAAAIAATIVNPYALRALVFPLELMTRINGSNSVYTTTIGEFHRTFSAYFPTFALRSYQAFIFAAAGLAVVAGWLRATSPRSTPRAASDDRGRFDVGVLAFSAALAWLSFLARRNIGIFTVGAVPFAGATLGIVLGRAPKAWAATDATRRAGGIAVLAGALALSILGVTNRWYAMRGEAHEFGLGVFEPNFQTRATQFFREQKLPGPIYNDMNLGGYLAWDDPSGKGVYIDGRLEVYDTPFFTRHVNHFSDFASWKRETQERGIQTVMLYHRMSSAQSFIRAVDATGDWARVYDDETAVIFVKAAGNAELIGAARDAFTKTWLARNEAALTAPLRTHRWQWGVERYTAQIAYARVLEVIGDIKEAGRWFEVAIAGGLPPAIELGARRDAAECLLYLGDLARARVHLVRALELDPASETARAALRRLDEHSGGNPTTLR
jgi:hypothetical protein